MWQQRAQEEPINLFEWSQSFCLVPAPSYVYLGGLQHPYIITTPHFLSLLALCGMRVHCSCVLKVHQGYRRLFYATSYRVGMFMIVPQDRATKY